jgi:peptidoglycan-associated lipoprotein
MRSTPVAAALTILLAACAHSQPPPPPPPPEPKAAVQPPPPAPAPVEPAAPRTVDVNPASIYFDFDSAELSTDARSTLQAFFDQARQRPDLNVRIEGNCDERGTTEYNLALGQRRADSAKAYLVNLGLGGRRIIAVSYGEERPRAPGHDEEAWRQNRRDDLVPVTGAVGQLSR